MLTAGTRLDRHIEGKKRVRFILRRAPARAGGYFVTVGLDAGESGRLHVQTQRYWFEVVDEDARTTRGDPVDAATEDL